MFVNSFYKQVKNINGDSMRIKEIMSKNIIAAKAEDSICDVAKKMKEYNIGFLPIVSDKKLVGIITDRDIVISAVANKCNLDEPIENYMNKTILSISYDRELSDALNLMAQKKLKRLIVSDREKIAGIISISDLLITNLDSKVLSTIKTIWTLKDNKIKPDTEVDSFYL